MNKEQFLENYEYLLRLKQWAESRLRIMGNDSERRTAGTGIAEIDGRRILKSFSGEVSSYHMWEDPELKMLMEEMNSEAGCEKVRLGKLAKLFHLSVAEQLLLFLSVLPEMDGAFGRLFMWLNANPAKKYPTMETASEIMGLDVMVRCRLCEDLGKQSSLMYYLMEETQNAERESFWMRELIPDQRIAGYIMGIDMGNETLRPAAHWILPEDEREMEKESPVLPLLLQACSLLKKGGAVYLYGASGCGKKELLKQFSFHEKRKILLWNCEKAKETGSFRTLIRRAVREAVLTGSALAAEQYQELENENRNIFQEEIKRAGEINEAELLLLILSTEKPEKGQNGMEEVIPIPIEAPSFEERKMIWEHYLKKYGVETNERDRLAAKFLFLPGQIREAVRHYRDSLKMQGEAKSSIYESCFSQIDSQLYKRASKINTVYHWDQLILPDSQKLLLHHICTQMENKYRVYETWGFGKTVAYGKGVSVIFSGPPGTGKTMAAQILANELNLELFKIDLSQMVSKYVGETEKNLSSVFKEGETSHAILFFDEADSLFGKRSEVQSSNDRYANLETSYLLQRLEEYEGMTILATNYLKNIDDAFIRRMKYIIKFQFPDADAREKIWKVTMPKEAPIAADVDYRFLAENLELAGGNIKNIAVYAAFMAADQDSEIGMRELLRAARYELEKSGKTLLGKELDYFGTMMEK